MSTTGKVGMKRRNSEEFVEENANEELLQLQWSNYSSAFGSSLANLRTEEAFCDLTLTSASGTQFSAHKVVISACSGFLQKMLKNLPRWQHPVLIMPENLPAPDLRDILTFMYSGEVHVERGRLQSFLKSADLLKVYGLCEHANDKAPLELSSSIRSSSKKSKIAVSSSTKKAPKSITTTISPLRPNSRENMSPKPGPSRIITPLIATTHEDIASTVVKDEALSDEENNLPEHLVIPSDPNSIQASRRRPEMNDPIAASNPDNDDDDDNADEHQNPGGKDGKNLVVLFSESARCHFCNVLCPDRATLKAHLEDTHQPPRHALCENCENFFHVCAITRHKTKCMERYQQQQQQQTNER